MRFSIRSGMTNDRHYGTLGKGGCGLFCIIGIIGIAIGCFLGIKNLNDKKNQSAETIAIVENYDVVEDYDMDDYSTTITYYPIFNYTVDSKPYSVKSSIGTSSKKYAIGEEVTIYYNPSAPLSFRVEGDNTMNWLPIILMAVGVVFVIISVSEYKRFKKYANEPAHENISDSVTRIDEMAAKENENKIDDSFVTSNDDHHVDTPDIK